MIYEPRQQGAFYDFKRPDGRHLVSLENTLNKGYVLRHRLFFAGDGGVDSSVHNLAYGSPDKLRPLVYLAAKYLMIKKADPEDEARAVMKAIGRHIKKIFPDVITSLDAL